MVVASLKLAELLEPGAVATTVKEYVPGFAVDAAVSVNVDDVAELVGEKLAVTPAGKFATEKLTAPLKPFKGLTVITSLPLDPCGTVTLVAAGDRLKVAPAEMTSETVVLAVVDPEVPVTVSG